MMNLKRVGRAGAATAKQGLACPAVESQDMGITDGLAAASGV